MFLPWVCLLCVCVPMLWLKIYRYRNLNEFRMVVLKINTAKKKRETGLPSRTAKRMWSGAFPAFPESQSTQAHTHTRSTNAVRRIRFVYVFVLVNWKFTWVVPDKRVLPWLPGGKSIYKLLPRRTINGKTHRVGPCCVLAGGCSRVPGCAPGVPGNAELMLRVCEIPIRSNVDWCEWCG